MTDDELIQMYKDVAANSHLAALQAVFAAGAASVVVPLAPVPVVANVAPTT